MGRVGNMVLWEGCLPGALHLCISTPPKQDSGLLCGHCLAGKMTFNAFLKSQTVDEDVPVSLVVS